MHKIITNTNQFQASSDNAQVQDKPYAQMTMKKKQGKCLSLTTISAIVGRTNEWDNDQLEARGVHKQMKKMINTLLMHKKQGGMGMKDQWKTWEQKDDKGFETMKVSGGMKNDLFWPWILLWHMRYHPKNIGAFKVVRVEMLLGQFIWQKNNAPQLHHIH